MDVLTAVMSALISLGVALMTQWVSLWLQRQEDDRKARDRINLSYLNPLRLHLEESYARLSRISQRLADHEGTCPPLLSVQSPSEVSEKSPDWFTGDGYYLISSCYLITVLFFQIQKVKQDVPFLQLDPADDANLLDQIRRVSLAFAHQGNIFYIVQNSVGADLYQREQEQVMQYRAFCQLLQDSEQRIWFDPVITFFLAVGKGDRTDRIHAGQEAIANLLHTLETYLGGSTFVGDRLL